MAMETFLADSVATIYTIMATKSVTPKIMATKIMAVRNTFTAKDVTEDGIGLDLVLDDAKKGGYLS